MHSNGTLSNGALFFLFSFFLTDVWQPIFLRGETRPIEHSCSAVSPSVSVHFNLLELYWCDVLIKKQGVKAQGKANNQYKVNETTDCF